MGCTLPIPTRKHMHHSPKDSCDRRGDPFDHYLGSAATRYFGEGFRHVEHRITHLDVDANRGAIHAVATATVESVVQCGDESVSRFRAGVGPLSVVMSVQHPHVHRPVPPQDWPSAVFDPAHRIYGDLHKVARIRTSAVRVEDGLCTATIERTTVGDAPVVGMESAYGSSAHVIGMVVLVAQMAQVLLSSMDGLSREEFETLWMRRISITVRGPVRQAVAPLDVRVRAQRAKIVDMRSAGRWRISDFALEELCGVSGIASVAHRIGSPTLVPEAVLG
ncbi:AvrD family protein [Leifsonia sp. NPDC056824]|uniref:AvrD family protein n=1 Tax=Leifsonia sp. NPDC056824 TaxID=3345953 RepID=UPI0036C1FC43